MVTGVFGLGDTGISCIQYFCRNQESVVGCDTRLHPPGVAILRERGITVPLYCGHYPDHLLPEMKQLILSPGISPQHAFIKRVKNRGIPVYSDIDLFSMTHTTDILAITGSNGKSTVTSLVGAIARAFVKETFIGGNLGTPVMSAPVDCPLSVLELSSFQLEITGKLPIKVACILNITPDHLDRHGSMAAYQRIKHKIYQDAASVVYNRDDPLTEPQQHLNPISFGLSDPLLVALPPTFDRKNHFGISKGYLVQADQKIIALKELPKNLLVENALAAIAIGYAAGFPIAQMLPVLASFQGLQHRCQTLGQFHGVSWVNDSKATNVAATYRALQQFLPSYQQKLLLIMGGRAKELDFSALVPFMRQIKSAYFFGECAHVLERQFSTICRMTRVDTIERAVALASLEAESGDVVLFSPACASFDQFKNFADRGRCFTKLVKEAS